MSAADRSEILRLVDGGHALDLVDLLLGDSSYRVSPTIEYFPSDDARNAYVMTIEHLRFVSAHGKQDGFVKVGQRVYFAYPEYFRNWLDWGTPGLTQEDLLNYLRGKSITS
ncbi:MULTISPECIES: hypothetical protein [Burkholderia]|uniref:Uncharacterized protein n=2 Tax=Burkholderia cepacia TaxID=292 RepID=A0AAE8NLH6_BURCE|nr:MULTISPECIES: hypothetical protein [Burkholderia]KVH56614.1 hypothetical protein WJ40_02260 [Burkholderia cepacia]KVQ44421.1 hypothetical protein WK03_16220 [Burkholderia cepacia]MBW5809797.1 hypothetical protein [Burkholderia sp. COPS]MCA8324377.1 hypothetical protein [Burkholderia cepacia]MDN7855572.1 hypothetical protein [Burkholderia cepacia]